MKGFEVIIRVAPKYVAFRRFPIPDNQYTDENANKISPLMTEFKRVHRSNSWAWDKQTP